MSGLLVASGCGLGGQFQCCGRVVARHVKFDQLHIIDIMLAHPSSPTQVLIGWQCSSLWTDLKTAWVAELLIRKELVQLVPGLDAASLVAVTSTKYLGNVRKVPGLNVVVAGIPTVDVSLNGVALVANNKSAKGEETSQICALCRG